MTQCEEEECPEVDGIPASLFVPKANEIGGECSQTRLDLLGFEVLGRIPQLQKGDLGSRSPPLIAQFSRELERLRQ